MPLYRYIAKTKDGKNIKKVEEVPTKEELITRLRNQGLFIISIREVEKKGGSSLLKIFRSKHKRSGIKPFDLAFLARNLSITLSSGVPLLRSLEIISLQIESEKLAQVLRKVSQEVKAGLSLSEAFTKHPKVFSPLWTGLVEVGEASGNLPFVLEKLADYLELRLEFERKIKSALVYPTILVVFAIGAVFFFFKFILPRFTAIFKQFDMTLPLFTQILFNISEFVNKNFLFIGAGFVVAVMGLWYLKRSAPGRRFLDRVNLVIPLVSKLTIISCLERFSSTMYILLESGVPIVYTLDVTARSIGNTLLEKDIHTLKENVRKGRSLSSELSQIPIFPPLITEITKVGEEAGNLPEMFKKIATHYQKELTTRIERLIAMFEPLIILFMGIIIGSIVISLFLPLFKLSTMGG